MPISPEVLTEFKRRSAEQKQMIASGVLMVCSKTRPMPNNRDQTGQLWFHEDAKTNREATQPLLALDTREEKKRIYKCPNCLLQFPVILRKVVPRAS